MRIAIVGFGPKGLFALERLLDHATALPPTARLDVDLFEPDRHPGAGPNYAPDQPGFLRMNFAADLIDMWWPDSHAVPRSLQRSFPRWRPVAAGRPDAYPSRAQVGAYLSDGFESLLRHAPRAVTIRLRELAVDAVRANDTAWDVCSGGSPVGTYDEVLLATGHEQRSADGLEAGWMHSAPLVPRVFPIAHRLAPAAVPPGACVAIRGFGLTFIDAAIALTEGRGGSFHASGHPYRLTYSRGPDDAGLIVPFSRTGLPMLAKPGPEIAADHPELGRIAARERAAMLALDGPLSLADDVLPMLARTASASLLAVGQADGGDPAGWLAEASASLPHAPEPPAVQIERSLAVGAGVAPPDLLWAIGHSWRSLYPALVARLGGSGLRDADWPAFRRLAAELERVSFGPAPANAARLLALIEAGIVELSYVAGGMLAERGDHTVLRSGGDEIAVDAVIDAVLPGPGIIGGQNPLLDGLLADGHVRVVPGRRGLDVDEDGTCLARDGSRTAGLSAIGRPTEDAVIGNDTLSRTLHPLADHWAHRVVHRPRVASLSAREPAA